MIAILAGALGAGTFSLAQADFKLAPAFAGGDLVISGKDGDCPDQKNWSGDSSTGAQPCERKNKGTER